MTYRARLLFVDDDTELLASFADLWGYDFDVETADSGPAALAKLATWKPDVIVSDMRMPGMDGAAFLAKARALDPDPVRMLLTGHADIDAAIRAVNDGAIFRFLAKPCEHAEMAAAIAAAIELGRRTREAKEQRAASAAQLAHTERLVTLGTITATLGHELNNSLSLLQLAIEDVVRDAETQRPPNAETVGLLVAGKNRLVAQSTGALKLARRSSGDASPLDVAEIVEELAATLRASGVVRHVALEVELGDRDARILGDRVELEQVLVNLIKNAVDAGAKRVRVRVGRTTGGDIELRVSDTGSGIAPDQLERVFEPYFTTKPPGVGTGLGLPVVRQLVERARGTIEIASELGRGTEIAMRFPAVAAAA